MNYLIGLLVGLVIAIVMYKLNQRVALKWYDWVIALVILVLLSIGGQHLISSITGFETEAAWFGFAIFGGLAIILALVEWQLVTRRAKA